MKAQVPRTWLRREALASPVPCLRAGARDVLFSWRALSDALAKRAARGEEVSHGR